MISFVIINYNTYSYTQECVFSICNNFPNEFFEIIIVDNGESNDDFEILTTFSKEFNSVRLFKAQNKGFGHANNFGISKAEGEFVFIINSDAELLIVDDYSRILDLFDNPNIGLIAPKVLNTDGSIQPNSSLFVTLFSSSLRFLKVGQIVYNSRLISKIIKLIGHNNRLISSYFNRDKNADIEKFVDWSSGCGLLFRKDDFEQYGSFDENFFMYYEDEELCYRYKMNNKRVFYYPGIVIKHHVGASNIKRINAKIELEKVKSEFYYYKKHYPKKLAKLKLIYLLFSIVLFPFNARLRVIAKSFLKGELV